MHAPTEATIRALALLLHQWRFLRRDQLAQLLSMDGAEATVILDKLTTDGMVQCIAEVTASGVPQPVYALARRGADLAASILGIDRAGLSPAIRRSSTRLLFLEHKLRINDIRLAFAKAARENNQHSIQAWRYEREVADRIQHPRRPGVWLPVRPDGYLVYQADGRRMDAFVEADLGTVTNLRWRIRVEAYVAYRLSGAFRNRYGAPSFRVLTVTTTRRRLLNLVHATGKAGGRSMFWFATWDDLAAHSALSSMWFVAGTSRASPMSEKRGSSSRGPPASDDPACSPRGGD
jgi:hypothetical protein